MLQVVESAAIGDRGNHGTQLQRRHGNTFSERAHLAYAAKLRRNFVLRISSEVLAFNVVSGQFAQAELVGVEADFFESELASQSFKVGVVGMGQSGRQVHPAAARPGRSACLL